ALAHGSEAVQVRVITLPFVRVLRIAMVDTPPASVAVGGSKLQLEPKATVLFAAITNTGAIVSVTVTVCEPCDALPQASVACQTRVAEKVFPHAALVSVLSTITF